MRRESRSHRHRLRRPGHRHLPGRERQRRRRHRQGRREDRHAQRQRCRSTSRACSNWCSATAASGRLRSPPTSPPASGRPGSSSSPSARRSPTTGDADLTAVWAVADASRDASRTSRPARPGERVVIKSTVPVGTNAKVAERLAAKGCRHVDVASNPEFLKEGAAIDDFMKPDRVVVGVRKPEVGEVLRELYAPFLRTERPFLVMSPESAEMTKYAANAMLATKISFINEMANLCDRARRRHQRRPPRHRPRPADRLPVPLPRPRLRRVVLPEGRARRSSRMGRQTGLPLQADAGRRRGQRRPEAGAVRQGPRRTSAAASRARRSPSGAWRSSRGPTTSARPRP